MKTYITIIISILFISTCFAQKDLLPAFPREINIQDGIAYFNGSPFTGLLFDEKTNKRIGEYKNGYKNGFFIEYHKNGIKKSECNYILGRRDGIFKDWFENGNKWSEIKYKTGLKDGTCTEWFENKQQRVSYVYKDGYLLDGTYITFLENGQKESQTTYKDEQIILSGKYENGKFIVLLELSIELYPNGQKKSEGFIKNGKKEELWTSWHQQGQKKNEGYYVNGEKNGKWVSWFENGKKEFEGNYKNGKEEGIWIYWYAVGQKMSEGYYKNGVEQGVWEVWFENGKKEFEGNVKDGKKDGYGILTLPDGGKYEVEWKNGKMNGKGSYYIDWGQGNYKSYKGYFVDDLFEGQGTMTGVSGGTPWSQTGEFKNGKLFNGFFSNIMELNGINKKVTSEYRKGKLIHTQY